MRASRQLPVIAVLSLACQSTIPAQTGAPASEPTYRFVVTTTRGQTVPGATAESVGAAGRKALGASNQVGVVSVALKELRKDDVDFLVICLPNFYCAAIPAKDPDLTSGVPYMVVLVPKAVR